jgi:transcriptional regulator with XRE-family HTH domain
MQKPHNLTLFLNTFIFLSLKKTKLHEYHYCYKAKKLRKKHNLSQEQVVETLHITQSTYARIEKGETNSWASYTAPLCKLYHIEPQDLLKQDSIIVNQNQKGGNSNNAYIINQLSEKLVKQYEIRLDEKDVIIAELKQELGQKN